MSIRIATLSALLLSFLCVGPAAAVEPGADRLQRVLDDLEVMEALLSGRLSEATRRELLQKVHSVRTEVQGVQQELKGDSVFVGVSTAAGPLVSITMQVDESELGYGHADTGLAEPPLAPPEPPAPRAMSTEQLLILRNAVETEAFGDSALAVLRAACSANLFDVGQAVTLIDLFDFGDDKVAAAVMLYPRLVDPENFYQVYGVFEFDSDKEELRQQLGL